MKPLKLCPFPRSPTPKLTPYAPYALRCRSASTSPFLLSGYDQPDHLAMIKCSICPSFYQLCRHLVVKRPKVWGQARAWHMELQRMRGTVVFHKTLGTHSKWNIVVGAGALTEWGQSTGDLKPLARSQIKNSGHPSKWTQMPWAYTLEIW